MTDNHLLLYRLAELMLEHEQHMLPVDLLFDDAQIVDFVKSIQIDSPYQQMLLEGVLTESVRDEKLFVSFTVEGYFHFLLGNVISNLIANSSSQIILQKLINSKLNGARAGIEEYLIKCVEINNETVIYEFIDQYTDFLNIVTKPFASLLLLKSKKDVLEKLFEQFSDNDIEILLQVLDYMYKQKPIAHIELQNELLGFKFLTKIEKFKKTYVEALSNTSLKSIDLKLIDDISSKDSDLDFLVNIEKINLYRKLNQYQLAEMTIDKNVSILSHKISVDKKDTFKTFYNSISFYYSEVGKYNLAVESSLKALSFSSLDEPDYGVLLNNLALRYIEIRKFSEASDFLERALSIDLKKYGQYSRNVASRYGNIALLNIEQSKYGEAIVFLNKAIQIDKSLFGNHDDIIATRLINLSEAYRNINQTDEALKCILEARNIDIINYGIKHPMIAYSFNIEAHIYSQLGELEKAIHTVFKAIEINRAFQNGINDRLNRDYNFLGVLYAKSDKLNDAIESFLYADKIESEIFKDNPDLRIVTWINICKVYCKMQDKHNLEKYLGMINSLPETILDEYSKNIEELIII